MQKHPIQSGAITKADRSIPEKLNSILHVPDDFDPRNLKDPIALQTDWQMLRRGGVDLDKYKAHCPALDRLELRTNTFWTVLKLITELVAFLASAAAIIVYWEGLWPVLAISIAALYNITKTVYHHLYPPVFDKVSGFYYAGRKAWNSVHTMPPEPTGQATKLSDIHAFQIIRNPNNSRRTYELNLVLTDASRMTVGFSDDRNRIHEAASQLAEFLNRPVWDGINENARAMRVAGRAIGLLKKRTQWHEVSKEEE